MSDDDVTVEKVEKALFRILDGQKTDGASRVEAAKILLARLDDRNTPPLSAH